MNDYFKIVIENKIADVCEHNFLRWTPKHRVIMYCEPDRGEYIQSATDPEKLYHAEWMLPIKTEEESYLEAGVIAIEEEEYEELKALLMEGKDIAMPEPPEEPSEDIPTEDTIEESIKEPARPMTIMEMREMIESQAEQIKELNETLAKIQESFYH